MKNTITSLFLIFTLSNLTCAASEPKAINTKDLVDKIDRSEISTGEINPTLENILPNLEMPKIEFKERNTEKKKSNNSTQRLGADNKQTLNVEKKSKPKKVNNTVVFAKRPISLVQLLNNDKIVLSNSQTYVYRLNKNTITQYKINDKVPLKSHGLKASGENSFYVVDVRLLKNDAKEFRKKSKSQIKNNTKITNHSEKINKATNVEKTSISPEITAKRKLLEKKLNHGKSINSTINLRSLQTNDEVIISGDVQLVIRKKKSTSGVKKYWLSEKLDTNNSSVIAIFHRLSANRKRS